MLPAAHGLEAARAVVAPIYAHESTPLRQLECMHACTQVSTDKRDHTHKHTLAHASRPTHARAYASISYTQAHALAYQNTARARHQADAYAYARTPQTHAHTPRIRGITQTSASSLTSIRGPDLSSIHAHLHAARNAYMHTSIQEYAYISKRAGSPSHACTHTPAGICIFAHRYGPAHATGGAWPRSSPCCSRADKRARTHATQHARTHACIHLHTRPYTQAHARVRKQAHAYARIREHTCTHLHIKTQHVRATRRTRMHTHAHRRHTPTQHASAVARKQAHRRTPAYRDPTCRYPCRYAYAHTRTLARAQDRPHTHARIRHAYTLEPACTCMLANAHCTSVRTHGIDAARAVVAPIYAHEPTPLRQLECMHARKYPPTNATIHTSTRSRTQTGPRMRAHTRAYMHALAFQNTARARHQSDEYAYARTPHTHAHTTRIRGSTQTSASSLTSIRGPDHLSSIHAHLHAARNAYYMHTSIQEYAYISKRAGSH